VADLSASLGVPLDEWQENVLEAAMGERTDGRWAARLVGVSTPRQNGKSQLIVARALAGVLLFGEQNIICSAHQTDTAREVFQRLLDIIDDNPGLKRRVDSVMKAINREYIRFTSGQVIRVKARSVGGGRGFSCDCLLLDEAQILGSPAWSAILPTMSARPNPQAWLLGTPPTPQDDGEVFTRLRQNGVDGKDAKLTWVEWSADEGDDPNDPATWAKANPAFGTRITHEAVEAERAAMSPEQFAMERLGMWSTVAMTAALPYGGWLDLADPDAERADVVTFGADVAEDRTAWIAVAWRRPDGSAHVSLANEGSAMPAFRLVEESKRLTEKWRSAVVPPRAFEEALEREGVKLRPMKAGEFATACGAFADALTEGQVHHDNQAALNAAVKAARWRPVGTSGERAWQLKDCPEIGPLAAATRALHGLQKRREVEPWAAYE
jgi:phage terminase large subunit-like protein